MVKPEAVYEQSISRPPHNYAHACFLFETVVVKECEYNQQLFLCRLGFWLTAV